MGVKCDGDIQCFSGRCYNGFCTKDSTSSDTCSSSPDSGCGKCDKISCLHGFECQNGDCDASMKCYDTRFWIILLASVLAAVAVIVISVSLIIARRRKLQRLNAELAQTSEEDDE